MNQEFYHHQLENGLTVIAEQNPNARSVALGFFVRAGSRDETPEIAGVSHFLEHMAFKGSERRTAFDVNRDFDRIGADYNASTSEENTIYHAAVLPEYLPQALDVLSDLLKPVLRQEDFEMEKQVIINEIGRYEDMPGWAAYDQSQKVYFEGHKLGNSILGTPNTIAALTREQMTAYLNQRYTGPNITLSVAGCFDWPALLNEVRSRCTTWAAHKPSRLDLAETNGSGKFSLLRREKVSQEYVIMISPGPAASSTLRHAADLLGMAIGDDSGSRFYWELVDPGLAESASCYFREYQDTGAFYTSFSCDREQAQENLGIVQGILEDIGRSSISQEELDQARSKLLSRVVRSGERPKGRMFSMGSSWTYYEKYRSIDDELQDYEKVTLKDIQAVLTRFPMLQLTTVALGPLENLEMPWKK